MVQSFPSSLQCFCVLFPPPLFFLSVAVKSPVIQSKAQVTVFVIILTTRSPLASFRVVVVITAYRFGCVQWRVYERRLEWMTGAFRTSVQFCLLFSKPCGPVLDGPVGFRNKASCRLGDTRHKLPAFDNQ